MRADSGTRLLWLAAAPVLAFLALPTLVVIPMSLTPERYIEFPPSGLSLHSFDDLFADPQWRDAAVASGKVALIAVVIAAVIGASAAFALHGRDFRGKSVVVAIIVAPLVAPIIVLAFADYQVLAPRGLVGSVWGIGMAHGIVAASLVFIAVQAGLAGLDPALIKSAQSLGAGPVSVLRHVFWPATRASLLAGCLFAFTFSFDEAVIALFLSGQDATTLPVKMFTDIQFELTPKVAAVSTLMVLVATSVLLVQALVLLRRRSL
jgi:ABC-type spermidine/putrescine transport system permease subunit II